MAPILLPQVFVKVCVLAALFAGSAFAQDAAPVQTVTGQSADSAPPGTRAAQIEAERLQKSTTLQPDEPAPIESWLDKFEDREVLKRVTAGIGGFRVRFGGLITGSGFSLGPEYYRRFFGEQVRFRAAVRGSLQKFYLIDTEVSMPTLAGDHAFTDFYAQHYDYRHIDYYGPGPDSKKTGRSGYRLESTSFQLTAGVKPVERLRLGAIGRYLLENVSAGEDERFVATDQIYTEQTTPGVQLQSDFLQAGGFIQYDWRDNPGGPRRGGNYLAQFSSYSDIRRGQYSFNRLDLEVQQYIGFFNQRRVIALRGRIAATDPHGGDRVPFYLQPTMGGSDDLRGYRTFRFYDNNSVVLNGEYRWEVFSGLDMALFMDAGQVFDRWQQINLRNLKTDYGFGFRFNVRNDVFLRIDTGFSQEGFAIWFKFNNIF